MCIRLAVLVCFLVLVPKPAAADLIDLGNGIIYSTELDTMFLQDMNTPFTSGFSTTFQGRMSFYDALVWIQYLNMTSYLGYNDWDLSRSLPDLFFGELGNVGRGHPEFLENSMYPFTNVRGIYWTALGTTLPDRNYFWGRSFDIGIGFVDEWPLDTELSVTAQRRGAPIGVPEPSTLSLIALAGLGTLVRRFKPGFARTAKAAK